MSIRPKGAGSGASAIRTFAQDSRGNVAIIFALSLSVLIPAAGIAYDYSRLSALHNDLQGSVDSISQTMSQRINACLDTIRTDNGSGGYTLDNGCLNAGQYGADRRAFNPQTEAQTLLGTNFTQSGYDPANPPTVVGSVEIDKYTGRYLVNAQVGYKCVFMSLLKQDCTVTASSGAVTSNAFAQADRLQLTGPTAVEIWAGRASPSLPFTLTASKGWPGYTYSVGPTLPSGLTLNAATGQVAGQANVIPCTAPCNPQALPPTQFGATDSGDQNRGGINKQTAYHNITFTIVHPLELTYTGDNFNTVVGPGQYTYTKTPVRSGGKGPYTYTCSGLPAGHPSNPFTCDANTGVIKGQPYLTSGQTAISGVITVTVRDGRGITSPPHQIPYNFSLPALSGRALKAVTGKMHTAITRTGVFEGSGGWGTLRAYCTNLPTGMKCAGEGRDSYFNGTVYGVPSNDAKTKGSFNVTVVDDTERTVTFPVSYDFTPNNDPPEYDCRTETWIAYVDTLYKSVHDKYGSGYTRRIYVSCGTNSDLNIYAPGPYNTDTGPFGKIYDVRYLTAARYDAAREHARGICDALWEQHMQWDGRQGSYCTSNLVFNDVSDRGVFPSVPAPPAPPYCAWWKRDNGWGMTRAQGVQCYDGNGNPTS
ncbi:Tad domain-containing protein [Microvirga sp. BT688]|uniref:TadE/TadG family type IV pilus assembly protein n=1 Tax=Microvirga sp. TaxID=1873136 RepID=UPI001683C786|nr:pilus assembly protein TadG-related protein [Microvirga sp.]MBD2745774.1 Tad domain-containing protein [Microvirga sp.]